MRIEEQDSTDTESCISEDHDQQYFRKRQKILSLGFGGFFCFFPQGFCWTLSSNQLLNVPLCSLMFFDSCMFAGRRNQTTYKDKLRKRRTSLLMSSLSELSHTSN